MMTLMSCIMCMLRKAPLSGSSSVVSFSQRLHGTDYVMSRAPSRSVILYLVRNLPSFDTQCEMRIHSTQVVGL